MIFLYRLNGGAIEGASVDNGAFNAIDTTYFATVTDPATPDGLDLSVLKIWDGLQVRNATAPEIANFATAKAADDLLIERAKAKDFFVTGSVSRKAMRALIETLIEEINTLRAQHSLAPRTTAQALVTIENKIDAGTFD